MRYLLDTQVLIWWLDGNKRLKTGVRDLISESDNEVWVSVINGWEIAIKLKTHSLFKVKTSLTECFERVGMPILEVKLTHILKLENLPDHHKDPFDRMLVAQAQAEGLTLMTADRKLAKYPVQVLRV